MYGHVHADYEKHVWAGLENVLDSLFS